MKEMNLSWGEPHLSQECSCGQMWARPIDRTQVYLGPEELARALGLEFMLAYLEFCQEHEAKGHKLGKLGVCSFAPMPTA
jgi:hypothetical protein